MAFPPPTRPTTFTNDQPQLDTHPAEHNALSLAVNDLTAELSRVRDFGLIYSGTVPSGTAAAGGSALNIATFTTPVTGTWMVFHSVYLTSTAPVVASCRLFAAGVFVFDSIMSAVTNGTLNTVTAVGPVGAGSIIKLDLLNGGTQPVSCYSDPTNHRFFVMRCA